MKKSELIKATAEETGYSVSYVSKVLSGSKKNATISFVAATIEKGSGKKTTCKETGECKSLFDHSKKTLSEAVGFKVPESIVGKNLDKLSISDSYSKFFECLSGNIAEHHSGNRKVTQRDIDMMHSGFILAQTLGGEMR